MKPIASTGRKRDGISGLVPGRKTNKKEKQGKIRKKKGKKPRNYNRDE